MLKRQILVIVAGSLLAFNSASAGEPAKAKKTPTHTPNIVQVKNGKHADGTGPRLLSPSMVLAQAAEDVPPAPAVEGDSGAPPPSYEPVPMDMSGMAETVQLYDCVKYEDLDNVHPCAVTKIVAVLDPCQDPCDCCGPRCVYVQICVPPCGCPEIKTHHSGKKVKYDYGKYEIEITSKKGMVIVDYDAGLFNNF